MAQAGGPHPPYAPPQRRDSDKLVLATIIGGVFAIAAAGITAYATTRDGGGGGGGRTAASGTPASVTAPAAGTGAQGTAAGTAAAPVPPSPPATPSPEDTRSWTFLIDEDMKEGGIDMDRWPEMLGGDIDVGPYRTEPGTAPSDFVTSNDALIAAYGSSRPTPERCTLRLAQHGARQVPVADGAYYCVRTSEERLILLQVNSVDETAVALTGYGVAGQAA